MKTDECEFKAGVYILITIGSESCMHSYIASINGYSTNEYKRIQFGKKYYGWFMDIVVQLHNIVHVIQYLYIFFVHMQ